jgi:hypothetical protein
VYAAGSINGTGTFDFGNNVTSAGTYTGSNVLLVKYNSSGVAQWARSVSAGGYYSEFESVSVAPDSSVYAAGFINGTATFNFGNNVTATGSTGSSVLLVKYNSSGMAQWARTIITIPSGLSGFRSVSVAPDGSVYAAGFIYGTSIYDFGNSVTATGPYAEMNVVLVKYNSSGTAQWAQTVTVGSRISDFNSVSVASDGSVYAAGRIYGTGTYDFGNSVTATGPYAEMNVVLVKYNSSGTAQWAQTVTVGSSSSTFDGVSVGSDGSVYAAGYIYGTSTYEFGNSVTAAGPYRFYNVLLVKYNSSGVAQWARTVTAGSSYSFFHSVSVASDGSVYAAGEIYGTGTYNFGNNVTAAGTYIDYSMVLLKYDSSGTAQWAQTVTVGSNTSEFNSVSVASDDSVYAAGYIKGTSTYEFGNSVTTAGTYTGSNTLLVKYY